LSKWILAGVVVVAAAAAFVAWPFLNVVETGRTPEYPDLQPRSYTQPPARVAREVEAAVTALPAWELTGSGSGPGGFAVQAVRTTRVFRFSDDVTVHVTGSGGGSEVSVRSSSRVGKWDLGQNARNVRELLGELDRRLR
jgi:uncharacterized protein (DUF1499 family)